MSRRHSHAIHQQTSSGNRGSEEKIVPPTSTTLGVVATLPLALGFLEEARTSPQQLREHFPDGSNYRLELRQCEVAQTQVLRR